MNALHDLLDLYRSTSLTVREQGTYFEELTVCYLKTEPVYSALYENVLPYATWAAKNGLSKQDSGIDLVAETRDGQVHAVQCKLYAADHKVQKSDIDSFFTASGKKRFSHRLIVATTSIWSHHAEDALVNQQPPVTKLDLIALEDSVIDWAEFAADKALVIKPKKLLRSHQKSAVRGHSPDRHVPALREGRPRVAGVGGQQRAAQPAEEAGYPRERGQSAKFGG